MIKPHKTFIAAIDSKCKRARRNGSIEKPFRTMNECFAYWNRIRIDSDCPYDSICMISRKKHESKSHFIAHFLELKVEKEKPKRTSLRDDIEKYKLSQLSPEEKEKLRHERNELNKKQREELRREEEESKQRHRRLLIKDRIAHQKKEERNANNKRKREHDRQQASLSS